MDGSTESCNVEDELYSWCNIAYKMILLKRSDHVLTRYLSLQVLVKPNANSINLNEWDHLFESDYSDNDSYD